jgi:hypothetical protein
MSLTHKLEPDARWAAAHQLAHGELDERMSDRRWMVWLWIVVVIVAASILGAQLTRVLPSSASGDSVDPSPASLVMSGVLLVLAIGIGLAGTFWAAVTGRLVTRWRAVASPLTMRDRRWVLRQIRTAAPVDDETKRSVVLAVAAQNRRSTLGVAPLHASLVLIALSAGLRAESMVIVWLEAVVVVGFLLAYILLARGYRLAGRYLKNFG